MDPVEIVRQGYDMAAERYLRERRVDSVDIAMLDEFEARVVAGGRVLDLGCGAGRPIAKRLAARYEVTGIDISDKQVLLAREGVPNATFRVANMITADLGESLFEGVCSYYAMIHVPREHHEAVFDKIFRALTSGGVALLCLGAQDLEADYDQICETPMFWSHFDAETYLRLLPQAGFEIEVDRLVQDESYPESRHLFVVARKP